MVESEAINLLYEQIEQLKSEVRKLRKEVAILRKENKDVTTTVYTKICRMLENYGVLKV